MHEGGDRRGRLVERKVMPSVMASWALPANLSSLACWAGGDLRRRGAGFQAPPEASKVARVAAKP